MLRSTPETITPIDTTEDNFLVDTVDAQAIDDDHEWFAEFAIFGCFPFETPLNVLV